MDASDVVENLKKWIADERLTVRSQPDKRAQAHFLIRYPSAGQGHMFAVIVPNNRDLVAISSMTRVDEGQQNEMSQHMSDDKDGWDEWVHESRLHLIRQGVDWGIHMGHEGKDKPGPLQAFNVSLPIWFDGLTKNEFMNTLRKLWLVKLGLIHEIKYSYGPGVGKPGPVDDWAKTNAPEHDGNITDVQEIEIDEERTFGSGFDPSEWA